MSHKEEEKRYKEFVVDAHKAKNRSKNMVNRLMEHAVKTGDKKAVTTLRAKMEM
jgi:hypothetical protein